MIFMVFPGSIFAHVNDALRLKPAQMVFKGFLDGWVASSVEMGFVVGLFRLPEQLLQRVDRIVWLQKLVDGIGLVSRILWAASRAGQ
jgi:uncharacterized membrane protein YqgA involved in biofilm formation